MVAAGFERAAIPKFFETPFAVVEVGEGGESTGEFPAVFVGATVDDLLIEGAIETLDHATPLAWGSPTKATLGGGGKPWNRLWPGK